MRPSGRMRTKFILVSWIALMIPMVSLRAEDKPAPAKADKPAKPVGRDTLTYKDGDRIYGKLVKKDGDTIVFQSERFGTLTVRSSEAALIVADKAPEMAQTTATTAAREAANATKTPTQREEDNEEERRMSLWERFYPSKLTADVREFFGPWHGRFAFSTDIVTDSTNRVNETLEVHLQRKWDKDAVQFNARHDFFRTNETTTTDIVRGDAAWRHDFKNSLFTNYRPTLEWNRNAFRAPGVPADYVLLQQEIGGGINLYTRPTFVMRAGFAVNLFDTWQLDLVGHTGRTAESVFAEFEGKLPWRVTVTDRPVAYYSLTSHKSGWENALQVNKKLTETFSIGIRQEMRFNKPDASVQQYRLLRVLLGLDF